MTIATIASTLPTFIDEKGFYKWYSDNADYLNKSDFFWKIFRGIGMGIIKGLKAIAGSMQELFTDCYKLLNFTEYKGFQDWVKTLSPVLAGILVIAIMAIGITLIVNHEKRPNIINSIFLYGAIILLLPTGIGKLNKIVNTGKDAVLNEGSTGVNSFISNNIVDLLYVDNKNQLKDLKVHYDLTDFQISNLDINETVNKDTEGISDRGKGFFDYYITATINGEPKAIQFDSKGWLEFFDPPWYYRYDVNWLVIYIEIIAMILAYLFSSYKVVRLIWEIAAGYFTSYLFSADFTSSQKVVKALTIMRDSYIVLFFVAAFIRIYEIISKFVSTMDIGSISQSFIMLFISFCLIDGANLVEKITGIDAGLSSGFGKLAAGYSAMRGLGRATDGALFGNPMRGRKGLLNNKYSKGAANKGKESLKNMFNGSGSGGGSSSAGSGSVPGSDSKGAMPDAAQGTDNNSDKNAGANNDTNSGSNKDINAGQNAGLNNTKNGEPSGSTEGGGNKQKVNSTNGSSGNDQGDNHSGKAGKGNLDSGAGGNLEGVKNDTSNKNSSNLNNPDNEERNQKKANLNGGEFNNQNNNDQAYKEEVNRGAKIQKDSPFHQEQEPISGGYSQSDKNWNSGNKNTSGREFNKEDHLSKGGSTYKYDKHGDLQKNEKKGDL